MGNCIFYTSKPSHDHEDKYVSDKWEYQSDTKYDPGKEGCMWEKENIDNILDEI